MKNLKEESMMEEAISSAELSWKNDIDTLLTDPKASKGVWSLCGDDKRLITALFKKERTKLIEEIKAGLPEERDFDICTRKGCRRDFLTLLDRMYEK